MIADPTCPHGIQYSFCKQCHPCADDMLGGANIMGGTTWKSPYGSTGNIYIGDPQPIGSGGTACTNVIKIRFSTNSSPSDIIFYCNGYTHYFMNDSEVCQCGQQTDKKLDKPIELPKQETHGLIGWICPCCGKGNSPFVHQCSCPGNVTTRTSNTTGGLKW